MATKIKTALLALLSSSFVLIGCLSDEGIADKVDEVRAEVSAMTAVTGAMLTAYPIEGMLVKYNDSSDYNYLNFGGIENFKYERGNEYRLRLARTTLANPPADASIYKYKLIEVLSKQKKGNRKTIRLLISSETGEYKRGELTQDMPAPGMKIKEDTDEEWSVVPFNKIDGFEYVKGYNYELSVEKISLVPDPNRKPQWQTTQYVLLNVISKIIAVR